MNDNDDLVEVAMRDAMHGLVWMWATVIDDDDAPIDRCPINLRCVTGLTLTECAPFDMRPYVAGHEPCDISQVHTGEYVEINTMSVNAPRWTLARVLKVEATTTITRVWFRLACVFPSRPMYVDVARAQTGNNARIRMCRHWDGTPLRSPKAVESHALHMGMPFHVLQSLL